MIIHGCIYALFQLNREQGKSHNPKTRQQTGLTYSIFERLCNPNVLLIDFLSKGRLKEASNDKACLTLVSMKKSDNLIIG